MKWPLGVVSGFPVVLSACGSASDSGGFLFEGMLTRRRRGSPPSFLICLHRLSVRQHHVTEPVVKAEARQTAFFSPPG